MKDEKVLTGSEAVFGFCSWLTTRQKVTIMSASNDSAPIVELIDQFNEANGLKKPRENYTDYLTHPKS